MKIDTTTYQLPTDCYFQEKIAKSLILLHFTAGSSAEGAITFWKSNKNKVSTPFVVNRDGTIYQTFDPVYWSYHLGFKGTWAHDKRSVPIEIVNIGPLVKRGDMLYCWPNGFKTTYCHADETEKYVQSTYRGYDYYAAFPKVQLDSVVSLVDKISKDFGIPKDIPPPEKRGVFDPVFAAGWRGIIDHAAFRSDKYDIGSAFNWSLLL